MKEERMSGKQKETYEGMQYYRDSGNKQMWSSYYSWPPSLQRFDVMRGALTSDKGRK
jgi:hypothetical protein